MDIGNAFSWIKFKRINSLPTWQDSHFGQVRYDPSSSHLAFGTSTAWDYILLDSDVDDLTDLVLNNTLESSGTNPTVARGAGAGATATATVNFGNDVSGEVEITCTGGGYAAGQQIVVTFAAARPDTSYSVQLTAGSAAAAPLGIYYTARSTTTFAIATTVAPALNDVLRFSYLVIEDA